MSGHVRDTIKTYDAVASRYLETRRDGAFEPDWIRSFVGALAEGSTVLDLGSGPGRDAAELRRLGLNPICLDRSIGMLRAGVVEYSNPRVLGDMLALPIRDSCVSGVWSNASLLHLSPEDFGRALVEIMRVLLPGGRLYLSLKRGRGARWETRGYGKPRWFQYWIRAELDCALESAGFEISDSAEEETTRDVWLVRECVAGA